MPHGEDNRLTFRVVNVFNAPGFPFEEGKALLATHGAESLLAYCRGEDEIAKAAHGADVLIGVFTNGIQTLSASTLDRLPKLKLVVGMAIGYEGIDLAGATARGVCVANVPDYCFEEMANHTLLLLFALAKKLIPTVDAVRAGKWDATGQHSIRAKVIPPIYRLSGQTLGLIGMGGIARSIVPRATAFGLRVIACDPYVSPEVMRKNGVEPADIDTLLKKSDFVSLHVPLTDKTYRMIGSEQFLKMKRTAFFINTARGALVNERELAAALTGGIIAGAAVDVMDPEPPLADNPLLTAPNMIITPHVGHYSQEAENDLQRMPYEEAIRMMNGGWPRDIAFRNPSVKEAFLARWGHNEMGKGKS